MERYKEKIYGNQRSYNSKSGNNSKTCKFFEELEDVLDEKPYVKPIAIAFNLNKRSIISGDLDDIELSELSEDYNPLTQSEDDRPSKNTKNVK